MTVATISSVEMLLAGTGASNSLQVFAYTGPGPGLGLLGSLLAVFAVVLIGLLGLVLYPLRLMRKRLRKKKQAAEDFSR